MSRSVNHRSQLPPIQSRPRFPGHNLKIYPIVSQDRFHPAPSLSLFPQPGFRLSQPDSRLSGVTAPVIGQRQCRPLSGGNGGKGGTAATAAAAAVKAAKLTLAASALPGAKVEWLAMPRAARSLSATPRRPF